MGIQIVRKANVEKDIKVLSGQLEDITGLRELSQSRAFKLVRSKFEETINSFYNEMMDLCEDPIKNAIDIKCHKMVGDALSTILASIDSDIEGLPALKEQINTIRGE